MTKDAISQVRKDMAGGCACGRIRYLATITSEEAYLCHCRMCQRATGSLSIAFHSLPQADVRWTTAEPDIFKSSVIADRGYCATCGTSLTFVYPDSDRMDLTVASFDDPGFFRPAHHFGAESMHRAWLDTSGLPEYRSEEHASLVKRWMDTVGRLPI